VTAEGVRAGAHFEEWRERIADCNSCNAETAGACCQGRVLSGEATGDGGFGRPEHPHLSRGPPLNSHKTGEKLLGVSRVCA